MAKNVIINGVQYNQVPQVDIPLVGGGTAEFFDTSDANLSNANQMLNGVTAYSNGVKYTGTIQSKAAETFTPSTSNQTINQGQYLSGTQTILGDSNLVGSSIVRGKTIFGVAGTVTLPNISQDQVTKVLSIS